MDGGRREVGNGGEDHAVLAQVRPGHHLGAVVVVPGDVALHVVEHRLGDTVLLLFSGGLEVVHLEKHPPLDDLVVDGATTVALAVRILVHRQ